MKNAKPRSSRPLSRTIRDDGRPVASAVATTIAFGSCSPAAAASASHRRNIAIGSSARSASSRPPRAYSARSAARSMASSLGQVQNASGSPTEGVA